MIESIAISAPRGTTRTRQTTASSDRLGGLMQLAQQGDSRAYARLLKDIMPLVRTAIRRKRPFLNAADVDDLIQDTLMSVHVARATYDASRPFLPWLYALLANRMVDAARRQGRRGAYEVQTEDFDRACETLPDRDPGDGYGDPQLLIQAIGELPAGQRQAVELLKLQELTLEQAAARTGASIGALKVSMHRALTSLRNRLRCPEQEHGAATVRAEA